MYFPSCRDQGLDPGFFPGQGFKKGCNRHSGVGTLYIYNGEELVVLAVPQFFFPAASGSPLHLTHTLGGSRLTVPGLQVHMS